MVRSFLPQNRVDILHGVSKIYLHTLQNENEFKKKDPWDVTLNVQLFNDCKLMQVSTKLAKILRAMNGNGDDDLRPPNC